MSIKVSKSTTAGLWDELFFPAKKMTIIKSQTVFIAEEPLKLSSDVCVMSSAVRLGTGWSLDGHSVLSAPQTGV